jgi:hypothetical protein
MKEKIQNISTYNFFLGFLFFFFTSLETNKIESSNQDEIFEYENKDTLIQDSLEIEKVIEILKSKDPKKISEIMNFPYKFCDKFYPDICDENDFIKRFDEVFDEQVFNKISQCKRISKYRIKDCGQAGCAGFIIKNGLIWMNYSSGGIFRVGIQTKIYKKKLKKLIEDEKKNLDFSLRNFIVPVHKFLGIDVLVRIDLISKSGSYIQDSKYRLCLWKKENIKFEDIPKLEGTKPDILLDKSVVYTEGSMGLITYNFFNNDCVVIIEQTMDSTYAKGFYEKIFKDQKIDCNNFSMDIYSGYFENFNFENILSLIKESDFEYNFCKKESYNLISIY